MATRKLLIDSHLHAHIRGEGAVGGEREAFGIESLAASRWRSVAMIGSESLTKRTEPSAKAKLRARGWKLEAEGTMSSP